MTSWTVVFTTLVSAGTATLLTGLVRGLWIRAQVRGPRARVDAIKTAAETLVLLDPSSPEHAAVASHMASEAAALGGWGADEMLDRTLVRSVPLESVVSAQPQSAEAPRTLEDLTALLREAKSASRGSIRVASLAGGAALTAGIYGISGITENDIGMGVVGGLGFGALGLMTGLMYRPVMGWDRRVKALQTEIETLGNQRGSGG